MRKITAYGVIKDGKLILDEKDKFAEGIKQIGSCMVRLIAEKVFGKRSVDQNAYMHGVLFMEIYRGMVDIGWSRSDISMPRAKERMKKLFLTETICNEKTGECMDFTKDTSDLTTVQMNDFWDECIQWAAEYLSIDIPLPKKDY